MGVLDSETFKESEGKKSFSFKLIQFIVYLHSCLNKLTYNTFLHLKLQAPILLFLGSTKTGNVDVTFQYRYDDNSTMTTYQAI